MYDRHVANEKKKIFPTSSHHKLSLDPKSVELNKGKLSINLQVLNLKPANLLKVQHSKISENRPVYSYSKNPREVTVMPSWIA